MPCWYQRPAHLDIRVNADCSGEVWMLCSMKQCHWCNGAEQSHCCGAWDVENDASPLTAVGGSVDCGSTRITEEWINYLYWRSVLPLSVQVNACRGQAHPAWVQRGPTPLLPYEPCRSRWYPPSQEEVRVRGWLGARVLIAFYWK